MDFSGERLDEGFDEATAVVSAAVERFVRAWHAYKVAHLRSQIRLSLSQFILHPEIAIFGFLEIGIHFVVPLFILIWVSARRYLGYHIDKCPRVSMS